MQAVKQHGLEGVLAKRLDSPYQPDRRNDFWLKLALKPGEEFDVVRTGWTGKGLELLLVGLSAFPPNVSDTLTVS
jgi:bifunctional non-homologous end joining protein LigD